MPADWWKVFPLWIFVEGLTQYIWHVMRANWNLGFLLPAVLSTMWQDKPTSAWAAPLQMLAYLTTSLTKLQAAANAQDQTTVYPSNRHNLNNCQWNRRWETISNIGSSSNPPSRRPYKWTRSKTWRCVGPMCHIGTNYTSAVVNMESRDSLDRVQCCRMCLAESHGPSDCRVIPHHLGSKFIQTCKNSLNTFFRL